MRTAREQPFLPTQRAFVVQLHAESKIEKGQFSGFLGDYSKLKPQSGTGMIYNYTYVKPHTDFTGYTKFSSHAQATAEGHATDASTGMILWEGQDKRVGAKNMGRDTLKSWDDVDNAFKAWSAAFAKRLGELGACRQK